MTSRTKRRLAVLALALGLVAAAPYGFNAAVDSGPSLEFPLLAFSFAGERDAPRDTREVALFARAWLVSYSSSDNHTALEMRGTLGDWHLELPPAYITLRVACAAALASVWGLVVCFRALGRTRQRSSERHL